MERRLRASSDAVHNIDGDQDNGPDSLPRTSWDARTCELPEDLRHLSELDGMDGIRIDLKTGDLSAWSIDVIDDEEDDADGRPV